jgi:hypothetical protein
MHPRSFHLVYEKAKSAVVLKFVLRYQRGIDNQASKNPPIRTVANMATGYQTVLGLNKAIVSPAEKPNFRASAVEMYVA